MKRVLILMLCGMIVAAFSGLAVSSEMSEEKLCVPTGTITIHAPEGVEAKRAPVAFPHSAHFDYACKECHHNWEGDTDLNSCTASGCHELTERPDTTDPSEAILYFKKTFHKKCISCHAEIKRANKAAGASASVSAKMMKTGPTGCKECHPKEGGEH